tara:strand:+ start:1431 stop:2483 length:1053 start_codon:yes stop_codon:yes gene_type:complete
MRIAVCISGCPRSYKISAPFIRQFYEFDKKFDNSEFLKLYNQIEVDYEVEIDYFIHSWDENWYYWNFSKDYRWDLKCEGSDKSGDFDPKLKKVEKLNKLQLENNFTKLYNPKVLKIEKMNVLDSVITDILDYMKSEEKFKWLYSHNTLDERRSNYHKIGQTYAANTTHNLAKNWAIENNIEYDVVVRQRPDCIPVGDFVDRYSLFTRCIDNKDIIYDNCHWVADGRFCMEDKMFYGHSSSMNKYFDKTYDKIKFIVSNDFFYKTIGNENDEKLKKITQRNSTKGVHLLAGYLFGSQLLVSGCNVETAIIHTAVLRKDVEDINLSDLTMKKIWRIDQCTMYREPIPEWVFE